MAANTKLLMKAHTHTNTLAEMPAEIYPLMHTHTDTAIKTTKQNG